MHYTFQKKIGLLILAGASLFFLGCNTYPSNTISKNQTEQHDADLTVPHVPISSDNNFYTTTNTTSTLDLGTFKKDKNSQIFSNTYFELSYPKTIPFRELNQPANLSLQLDGVNSSYFESQHILSIDMSFGFTDEQAEQCHTYYQQAMKFMTQDNNISQFSVSTTKKDGITWYHSAGKAQLRNTVDEYSTYEAQTSDGCFRQSFSLTYSNSTTSLPILEYQKFERDRLKALGLFKDIFTSFVIKKFHAVP